ncbi:uncharacterized protein [Halyomorpha halys]|uniref:uncharacterized protein n=1 Tax=Halyomorpha halys TaxID=286706 RepID=UPI0006D4FD6E|nr:uncharacterized protein LOC106685269 [Halyomorpha halys]
MRLLLCMLLWQGWSWAADSDNLVDLTGETVKQVESLLAKDPKLPRLTRGEIISLIEEVRNVSDTRKDKSLLVVLPYNGTESKLEDLFTKAPVTKLIGESVTTKRPKRKRKPTRPRPVYVHSTSSSSESSSTSGTMTVDTASTTPSYFSNSIPSSSNSETFKSKPYTEDLALPQPYKEALFEISVTPEAEADHIFVTPGPTTRGTAPPVPKDVANTAEALSPDLKNVLNNIGLIGDKTTEKPFFHLKAMAPSVDVSSYSRFKPLPTGTDVSDDMKSFLKSFGLLEPSRKRKSMRDPPKQDDSIVNEEMLTDDMKDILRNIGLLGRQSKKMHIFNPQLESARLNQTEHMIKINKILKKLREISEGNNQNLTQTELKELVQLEAGDESNKTLLDTDLDLGILPADEYQNIGVVKNEVKRQQPNEVANATSSSSASSDGAEEETSTGGDATDSPVTTESGPSSVDTSGPSAAATDAVAASSDATERTPSLDDLADSFGGEMPAEVSTKRPNGFYFLLDWNSFLDVGLDERKVSVNFSPKVGDPRNFIPVRIP